MRFCSLFALFTALSSSGCSRSERAHPKPTAAALGPSSSNASASGVPAFGPRADLAPQTELGQSAAASAEPAPLPPLPVVDASGLLQKIRASGHRGVVVNAWASWCDPCRDELPMLARVAPQLAAQGVPIWLVSVDDPDSFAAAQALLEQLHITLPAFAAAPPLQEFKAVLNPNWPGMIPVSFLFDRTGKLRYFWPGEVYEKELLPIVSGFVAGKHIDGTANFGLAPGATQGEGH